jgi:hypothetical protein
LPAQAVAEYIDFVANTSSVYHMEDKRSRFVRLAQARVTKASQMLRLIGNLSNTHNYEFSSEDAQKIISALEAEMKLLKAKFHTSLSKKARDGFTLD